jgi:hypothetical protein
MPAGSVSVKLLAAGDTKVPTLDLQVEQQRAADPCGSVGGPHLASRQRTGPQTQASTVLVCANLQAAAI